MCHGPAPSRRLVLASRSPRRRQLLSEAGLAHEPVITDVDDGHLAPGGASPAEWVTALAYLKARAARDHAGPDALILAADTVCVLDGRIIGQPRDARHAAAMITSMADRSHEALTGVCLLDADTGGRTLRHDRALVQLGPLTPEQIGRYVASEQWRGKAGAYNYFERLDDGWPLAVRGDPHTVVGLPIRLVRDMLARHGAEVAA